MRPRGGIHITHYNNSQSVSPAWAALRYFIKDETSQAGGSQAILRPTFTNGAMLCWWKDEPRFPPRVPVKCQCCEISVYWR